ncbi:MAG: preprotein translocase subunit SecA [Motiliproteus sp.]|jgi:preprotein translocase subunit SecA
MIAPLFKKIFGSKNDRELKRMGKIVKAINALEESVTDLSSEELTAKAAEFRQRFEQGETLDQLMPEAFAVCRETSKRALGMRHFDVQMIGGITLHEGRIAEMRTGEGKTLMSTLAAYLNAIPGKGMHIVTVNDYLAKRDADWMGTLYNALGLTVGVIYSGQSHDEKQAAYRADITYGTNNEFGFDYLRDNMAFSTEDKVQRALSYGIIDEVDSILIDEARTPLIISGPAEDSSALYKQINTLVPHLERQPDFEPEEGVPEPAGHYAVDEKQRSVELTEEGHQYVEKLLIEIGLLNEDESLYAPKNLNLLHHVHAGLRASVLYTKDVDYIVQNNEVVIVDEHTGRTMAGRRWSEGLHQAIEAKEGVNIQNESQTLASTTFQNFFRIYDKLSGMTGTADTEAFELQQIYGLDVVVIPTNQQIKRTDFNDLIFLGMQDKFDAIVEDVRDCQTRKQPVLVGTASIEMSEVIAQLLTKEKIEFNILNAKHHEREALVIADAGRPGTVTIATNMAGRGTDIVLGGNWESEVAQLDSPSPELISTIKQAWKEANQQVIEAGGLHIVGTERHESRRIDNQLRGRAGRQGDPGTSRFYLSLDDSLMRIFASEKVRSFMQKLGMEKGEAIEHKMVSNAIEKAQRKVEGRNFDIRKQLLEYDDVANDQRRAIYDQRNEIMASTDISDTIDAIREEVIQELISIHIPPQSLEEQWDVAGLEKQIASEINLQLPLQQWLDDDDKLHEESLRARILKAELDAYAEKEEVVGAESMRMFEKQVMLQVLDTLWKEHLATMDHLRQGIHLRGYAQKNPKQEFKRESFELFQELLTTIKQDVVRIICNVQVRQPEDIEAMEQQRREALARQEMEFKHAQSDSLGQDGGQEGDKAEPAEEPAQPYVREYPKVGRNEPCPCDSGKKYKQCHGKLAN